MTIHNLSVVISPKKKRKKKKPCTNKRGQSQHVRKYLVDLILTAGLGFFFYSMQNNFGWSLWIYTYKSQGKMKESV